jgi:hypothetical protein
LPAAPLIDKRSHEIKSEDFTRVLGQRHVGAVVEVEQSGKLLVDIKWYLHRRSKRCPIEVCIPEWRCGGDQEPVTIAEFFAPESKGAIDESMVLPQFDPGFPSLHNGEVVIDLHKIKEKTIRYDLLLMSYWDANRLEI